MNDSEWIKFSSDEVDIIASSLELSQKFLEKAIEEETKSGNPDAATDDAKKVLELIKTLLVKLE